MFTPQRPNSRVVGRRVYLPSERVQVDGVGVGGLFTQLKLLMDKVQGRTAAVSTPAASTAPVSQSVMTPVAPTPTPLPVSAPLVSPSPMPMTSMNVPSQSQSVLPMSRNPVMIQAALTNPDIRQEVLVSADQQGDPALVESLLEYFKARGAS